MKTGFIYDLEQFTNFHSGVFFNHLTDETFIYVVHEGRDDRIEYFKFLKQKNIVLLGFNNVSYDYPMLHYILKNEKKLMRCTPEKFNEYTYAQSQKIIDTEYSAIWANKVMIPQVDLYKIRHYDNQARRVGLKWLQYAMRWHRLQDLPYKHYDRITSDLIDVVIDYNINDVMSTYEFYKHCKPAIKLRVELSKKFGLDLVNANDPKIGELIFGHFLSKDMSIPFAELKTMRTRRGIIPLNECIFDYIKYDTPPFKALLEYLKAQSISETKGFFKNIPLKSLGELRKYIAPDTIKANGTCEILNVYYKGFRYDFGTGGIHGAAKSGIYIPPKGWRLISVDYKSYYPNLSIWNNVIPEHLGKSFVTRYKWFYDKRILIPKSNPMNYVYKLMLNGSFGKSNSEFSFFYDPKFLLSITLNGQLILTGLAEKILEATSAEMLLINTDGMEFLVKDEDYDTVMKLCKANEHMTKLQLDYEEYDKLIIDNVNNYIGVFNNGKIKLKGLYEIDRDFHKNHSQRIVPIALANYFINDVPVETTIRNHHKTRDYNIRQSKNNIVSHGIFDFLKAVKSRGNWYYEHVVYDKTSDKVNSEKLQKTNRYYIGMNAAENSGILLKRNPDGRRQFVEAGGYKTVVLNDYIEQEFFEDYGINYSYYINECNKVIRKIEDHQLTLF